MIRLVLFAIALLGATGAEAQVYKCIDAGGKVIYSQIPCPANTRSETMSRRAPAAAPAAAPSGEAAKAGSTKLTPEQAFQKRQREQQDTQKDADKKLAEAKQKEENCRTSREQLTQYQIGGRIAKYDAQGERYFLEDSQIAQERAKAQTLVDQWCR